MYLEPVVIYILIGVAHWASHLLQCGQCQSVMRMNTNMFLEAVVKTLGWPIHLAYYVQELLNPAPKSPPPDDVRIIKIEREPGETAEQHAQRVVNIVEATMKRKSNDPANP